MIRGLDRFRAHFAEHRKTFVLIGGVACHEWLSTRGLPFRATKDMDVVLVIEAVDQGFVKRFWEFVEAGKYQVREKASGDRELCRFTKPEDVSYPVMLEIFSRKPQGIRLDEGQQVVPVKFDEGSTSLSAILLDDGYYRLILAQHSEEQNLPFANPAALIPLKAKAWLDLCARASKGEKVDKDDIAKHRGDVFRIAGTLPGERGDDGRRIAVIKRTKNAFGIPDVLVDDRLVLELKVNPSETEKDRLVGQCCKYSRE